MNEGQVRVGSRTMEIGRLRSVVSLVAGLALGAGLAIGVVSAAPNGSAPELTGLPQAPRAPQGQAAARPHVRRPLHQLLLQLITGQAQRPAANQGRFAAGRITEVDTTANTITIVIPAPGQPPAATPTPGGGQPAGSGSDSPAVQTRVIRVAPHTRLPVQRPRPGDFILAVGRPERDGSLTARAIGVRRPGQLLRR